MSDSDVDITYSEDSEDANSEDSLSDSENSDSDTVDSDTDDSHTDDSDIDEEQEESLLYSSEDLLKLFNSEDIRLTSEISQAICKGDVEAVRKLIESNRNLNINIPNDFGNVLLHKAVKRSSKRCSLEILNILLDQPYINLNYQNHEGVTPLLASIERSRTDDFVMRLLQAGCDVNIGNNAGESPLHFAVVRRSPIVAHELLVRGADVNVKTEDHYTPLHYAIAKNNLEGVCILLCNWADVTITPACGRTPFMYAVDDIKKLDIARALIDYYDDFSSSTEDGRTALLIAAKNLNPIAIDIVKAGADVNCIADNGKNVLAYALQFENADLFKLVWPKFDKYSLLDLDTSILWTLTQHCFFPVEDWLHCLYLILDSEEIFDLIEHHENVTSRIARTSLLYTLFGCFFHNDIGLSDRLAIIYQCLSVGIKVYITNINLLNELYGFNEELEVFIQLSNHIEILNDYNDNQFPLLTFILAQEQNCNPQRLAKLFWNQIAYFTTSRVRPRTESNILKAFTFFSIPYTEKQEIKRWICTKRAILKKLEAVPELPSLTELCRNEIRKRIQQTNKIKNPCQFHNAVQKLPLPPFLKDVIRFKQPLY